MLKGKIYSQSLVFGSAELSEGQKLYPVYVAVAFGKVF